MEFLDGERPGNVIFLTDGLPTVGIEQADGILELSLRRRRPSDPHLPLRRGLRRRHGAARRPAASFIGSSHYVAPEEDIETEVARLYEEVSTPVLSDVRHQHRRGGGL
jgi:Ca-activated chloride channel family protein